jgi:twitching motility protein PilT
MTQEQLHVLLAAGMKHNASDIHLKVGDPPLYRVNGVLAPLKYEKLKPADTEDVCRAIIRDPKILDDLAGLQEYDTSYSLPGVSRFRVNIFRQRGSLSIVCRVIPSKVPTIDELQLPPVIAKIAEEERGLVLVTGATGSGKSWTLASIIQHVNSHRRCHILTIEDPIEFLHAGINASISQREIGIDTRGFGHALRSALRQDPDVILIGEMRDVETIDIALKAAETGHLVFSTIHTTDAAKTVGRLLSFFSAEEQQNIRYRVADNLKATISQRLLPRADGNGRFVAAEIMISTSTVQECIRDASRTTGLKDVIEKGRLNYHMQSFDQHLTDLLRGRIITMETAMANASNAADFQRALNFE